MNYICINTIMINNKEKFSFLGLNKKYYYEKAFWFSVAVIWGLVSMYVDETYLFTDYVVELCLVLIMIAGIISTTWYTKKLTLKFYGIDEDAIETNLTINDPGVGKTFKYKVAVLIVFAKISFYYVGIILALYRYALTGELLIILYKGSYSISTIYYNVWLLQTYGYIICVPIIFMKLFVKNYVIGDINIITKNNDIITDKDD